MHSKVKARDIVAGWPRGRSTTTSSCNSRWGYPDWWLLYRYPGFAADLMRDGEYHLGQATMLDRHRSEYRRPTAAWLARKIMQYGGGLVIATCCEDPTKITLGEPEEPWSFAGRVKKPVSEIVEQRMKEAERVLFLNCTIENREMNGDMERPK